MEPGAYEQQRIAKNAANRFMRPKELTRCTGRSIRMLLNLLEDAINYGGTYHVYVHNTSSRDYLHQVLADWIAQLGTVAGQLNATGDSIGYRPPNFVPKEFTIKFVLAASNQPDVFTEQILGAKRDTKIYIDNCVLDMMAARDK